MNNESDLIDELYDFRLLYNALLFNEWYHTGRVYVYKSRKHSDGEYCFDGEWFIVVARLPGGDLISNHYHIKYWDYFQIPIHYMAEYDGHTPEDVRNRLRDYIENNQIKSGSECEWYNCKHFISPLGASYCTKHDDYCEKNNCEEKECVKYLLKG